MLQSAGVVPAHLVQGKNGDMWPAPARVPEGNCYANYAARYYGPGGAPLDFDAWILREISEANRQMIAELKRTDMTVERRAELTRAVGVRVIR